MTEMMESLEGQSLTKFTSVIRKVFLTHTVDCPPTPQKAPKARTHNCCTWDSFQCLHLRLSSLSPCQVLLPSSGDEAKHLHAKAGAPDGEEISSVVRLHRHREECVARF